jgi:hypothetical protein
VALEALVAHAPASAARLLAALWAIVVSRKQE